MARVKNVLCIVSAVFGRPFLIKAKELGWNVYLLTEEKYLKEAWPREHLADVFAVPDITDETVVRNVVTYLARTIRFDRIVGLGEFDIEVAAMLREHTRIGGMGETTARYFRDKLAMRHKAKDEDLLVPRFSRILNYDELKEYMEEVPAPWVMKPRMSASSARISKLHHPEELWKKLDELGDKQTNYLLEEYIPGDVYHVDSVVYDYKVKYASVSKYGIPMLDLNTTGGIFTTRMIERDSDDEKALQDMNKKLVKRFGLREGVTHIEYIKGKDGKFYFLEAASRVGGARIPDVVWHATGLCFWHEWAKMELLSSKEYKTAKPLKRYGGAIFTLAHQEWPDMSPYNDPEIAWIQKKKNFAGLIVVSEDATRVEELLAGYYPRFAQDFMTHIAPKT